MSKKENVQSEVATTSELTVHFSIDHSNPLKKYNKLYAILMIIGAGFGLVQGNPIATIGLALFGFFISWIIVRIEAITKLTKLHMTNYPLSAFVPEEKILDYLKEHFSNNEVELNTRTSKIIFLYKNQTNLTVHINKDKNCFHITSKMTIGQKLKNGGKANSAKLYVNTLQVTPFLVQVIHDAVTSLAK